MEILDAPLPPWKIFHGGSGQLLLIELVHCLVGALFQEALDGIGSPLDSGIYGFLVLTLELAQNPVGHIVVGVGLTAHTDFQPGELVAAQVLNDTF
jgi:hypothetical protein